MHPQANLERDDIRQLFVKQTPLIDVRAPVEFNQGAFASAVNLPILDDEQRHLVGICYKDKGQQAAIALGQQLVSGDLKSQRIDAWQQHIKANPSTVLYCFRGGLRSKTSLDWLLQSDVEVPLVKGGYKALRRYLISVVEQFCQQQFAVKIQQAPLIVAAGSTGCGKTQLLKHHANIDLEGCAQHRGSSFGRLPSGQPNQINFENAVATAFIQQQHQYPEHALLIEDEGRAIGSLALPKQLYQAMSQAPLVLLEADMQSRVEAIYKDYVADMKVAYGDAFADYLTTALAGIKKRLGGVLFDELGGIMRQALVADDADLHRLWIQRLLQEYYDPMYQYQLQKKRQRIMFSGDFTEVSQYLNSLSHAVAVES